MKQEYLIQESEKETIESYRVKGVTTEVYSAGNGKCWYVRFLTPGENEKVAKQLSDIHNHICSNYKVIVLESGSSEYFNKRLYPLANEFECKLRKLLYFKSAINQDRSTPSNITDLESKDLGQIFSLLFIDTDFVSAIKDEIKKRNKDDFSKEDIIKMIQEKEENALWDTLLGKNTVPTLRINYGRVRNFRNDIMHSHLVEWNRYKEILSLFRAINEELTNAINEIEGLDASASDNSQYNEILNVKLTEYNQWLSTLSILKSFENQYEREQTMVDSVAHMIRESLREIIQSGDLLKYTEKVEEETNTHHKSLEALSLTEENEEA